MYVIAHKRNGYCIGPGGWDTADEARAWFAGRHGRDMGNEFAVVWVSA